MATLVWRGAVASAAVRRAIPGALELGAEILLERANVTVPHEEGILQASGDTDHDDTRAVVFYDTPYAVRQHEDTRLRHDSGRRAKWLEMAMRENETKLKQAMADELRRRLGW